VKHARLVETHGGELPQMFYPPRFKMLRDSYISGTLLRRTQPPSPRVLRTSAAV